MNLKRSYTAHPIMAVYYLKPFLFVLLIPLFNALIDALFKQEINGVLLNEIILASIISVCSVIKWRRFSVTVTDSRIIICYGLFFYRKVEIPKEKISSIQTLRHLTDRIFGSVTLRINTESGRKGKADFEIKVSVRDAESISAELFLKDAARTIKFSAIRVALTAAAASSAFTGLIFIVPTIKQSGILLGTAIEEIVLARITEASAAISRIIPPVINTVTIVFLLLYGVAFLISFFKYVNFKVRIVDGVMEIISGLITRFSIVFKIKSVNSAIIEQTPLMRFFGRYLVRVSIGGYGDNKGYKAVVIPSAKEKEVKTLFSEFFPNIQAQSELIKPHNRSRGRFYFVPTIFLLLCVAFYFVFRALFPVFDKILGFALIISLIVIVYYYNLAEYNFKNSAISISNVLYAKYTRWSSTRKTFCEADRVGVVCVTKWPTDRKYKTCNIRITERSESAESITVKHVPYCKIKEQLSKFYGIE